MDQSMEGHAAARVNVRFGSVNKRHRPASRPCPLHPRERTSVASLRTSAPGHCRKSESRFSAYFQSRNKLSCLRVSRS
jgi:hypothetical protein